MESVEEKKRLFSTSIHWYIITGLSLFALFFGLGTISLILAPPDYIFATTFFAISFIELYLAYRSYLTRVRKAMFYENSFEIIRRRKKQVSQYSQMERITKIKAVRFGESVSIKLAEEKEPIIVSGNPKNSLLGMDLCTFLKRKISKDLV